ncbi:hypothetical protein B7P43_G10328 [Cryptotermes secundus]|uniref:Securin n=1 Tax=Cryptotermes secundus TaxID=105785 RepID=A0A2J7PZF6_9NEOP|nr:uncharacterized protein LOC111870853 [Cryptotermes secundus]PNF21715.1 hypothetical protein B7P43_G10328 [Cryptotermes secundus]
MEESIFDIFGTKVQQRQLTVRPSSANSFGTLKGADNVKLKSSSVSDLPSSKKALGDAGNKIKSLPGTQELRKALQTNCDQENSFVKPPTKTPLPNKKPVALNKQTPNLKSTVRTPLSDIKGTASKKNQSVQNQQNSPIKNEETYSLFSEINAIDNFINGDTDDLSWLELDGLSDYEHIDDYEDIIPNSLRPSDEDIHRMVNFWEMETEPPNMEFESGLLLPLVEELDNGFGHTFIPDISDIEFDEDLDLVPVPSLD